MWKQRTCFAHLRPRDAIYTRHVRGPPAGLKGSRQHQTSQGYLYHDIDLRETASPGNGKSSRNRSMSPRVAPQLRCSVKGTVSILAARLVIANIQISSCHFSAYKPSMPPHGTVTTTQASPHSSNSFAPWGPAISATSHPTPSPTPSDGP